MPISVAIKIVVRIALANPQRAILNPANLDCPLLILRIDLALNHKMAMAIGSAVHFKRQAATSPAVTMAENRSHAPLLSTRIVMSDTIKPTSIKAPLMKATVAYP